MRRMGSFRHLSWIPWLFLLLTAGCSEGYLSGIDPQIIEKDTLLQRFQRLVSPEFYWKDKLRFYAQEVEADRVRFREENQRYRAILAVRRQQVAEAIAQARRQGTDTTKARQETMQAFRVKLDPQRTATREAGRMLRKKLLLFQQVNQALAKAQEP